MGLGIDLGIRYEGNKWRYGASINNVGSLTWKDADNYSRFGSQSFSGVDLTEVLSDTDSYSLGDTLASVIEFDKDTISFKTVMPTTLHANIEYKLFEKTKLGLGISSIFWANQITYQSMISVSRQWLSWLNMGTSLSYGTNEPIMIGLFGRIKVGPIEIFGSGQNVKAIFLPTQVRGGTLRAGLIVSI
jgi:hypothetical protein